MFEPLCAALDAAGIACTRNELLADHCTFRIGGPADIFIKPCDEIQLCRAVAFCKEQGARYYLLGNGSNILFEDAGFRGAVLDLTAMKTGIGMKENIPGEESGVVYCNVTVGAGMKLSTLCNFALNHSCTGLEFAYGIPGTVGGAIYMNAGAYGGEMKDVLTSVEYLAADGNIVYQNAHAPVQGRTGGGAERDGQTRRIPPETPAAGCLSTDPEGGKAAGCAQ